MYRLPLANYRVLDLGPTAAVAYAARLLGDAGAEVIIVERDTTHPMTRSSGFGQLNRDKLGCTLDFATPQGIELLRRLVGRCDVVVEGFDAPEREQLGLAYESLRDARRDVIVASVKGIDGAAVTLSDAFAGTAAAGAICAALLHHRDSGEGQHVEDDARDCRPCLPAGRQSFGDAIVSGSPRARVEPVSAASGVVEMPALPWRFSLTPCHVRLPAPEPGRHNRYVFGDLLGLSEEQMMRLEREAVIGPAPK